jgi:putative thioredoxin
MPGAFLLAKVNADEQQMIAQQFGVRSLPTVMIMQNGQPVDGFAGAQPETACAKCSRSTCPRPLMRRSSRGRSRSSRTGTRRGLSRCCVGLRGERSAPRYRHDAYAHALIEAKRLDDAAGPARWRAHGGSGCAVRADAGAAGPGARGGALAGAGGPGRAAQRGSGQSRSARADCRALQRAGQYREALESLLHILRTDLNHKDGATKKALLDTIASLGKGDPLAAEYQRKLFSLLY